MTTIAVKTADVFPRKKWEQAVNAFLDQLTDWVKQEPGWALNGPIEDYSLPQNSNAVFWSVSTPKGEARMESERQDFLGRRFVELYAWPTLRRVQLLPDLNAKSWKVRTDSGIFLRQEWNRENCILLIQDLIEAE